MHERNETDVNERRAMVSERAVGRVQGRTGRFGDQIMPEPRQQETAPKIDAEQDEDE